MSTPRPGGAGGRRGRAAEPGTAWSAARPEVRARSKSGGPKPGGWPAWNWNRRAAPLRSRKLNWIEWNVMELDGTEWYEMKLNHYSPSINPAFNQSALSSSGPQFVAVSICFAFSAAAFTTILRPQIKRQWPCFPTELWNERSPRWRPDRYGRPTKPVPCIPSLFANQPSLAPTCCEGPIPTIVRDSPSSRSEYLFAGDLSTNLILTLEGPASPRRHFLNFELVVIVHGLFFPGEMTHLPERNVSPSNHTEVDGRVVVFIECGGDGIGELTQGLVGSFSVQPLELHVHPNSRFAPGLLNERHGEVGLSPNIMWFSPEWRSTQPPRCLSFRLSSLTLWRPRSFRRRRGCRTLQEQGNSQVRRTEWRLGIEQQ